MKSSVKIILGSASPRRRELLARIVCDFEVHPAKCREFSSCTEPAQIVEDLACQKALAVVSEIVDGASTPATASTPAPAASKPTDVPATSARLSSTDVTPASPTTTHDVPAPPDSGAPESASAPVTSTLVIGSDTLVEIEGRILGKPQSPDEAADMLKTLSGRYHHVHTGVCCILLDAGGNARKTISYSECARVQFNKLSDQLISDYVSSGMPMDKAGAYGIQDMDGALVRQITGEYETVMGLPLVRLEKIIKSFS